MSESSKGIFIGFTDFFQALSSKKITRSKNGDLNISGNIISLKDFDKLYMHDISSMLSNLETTISPEFLPARELYSTLDILSSPVLRETKVPEAIKGFYKKLNFAISANTENRKKFEDGVKNYISESTVAPVFMIASLDKEIEQDETNNFRFSSLMPSSSELMDEYGKLYSGDDILYLANKGYINSKEPINMLIYKSLYAQDTKSENYIEPVSYDELLEFYSPEKNPGRMHTLLVNDEFDKNFSELHDELLENVSSKKRKDYIKDLIDETKALASTPSDYSNDLLAYTDSEIIPEEFLSGNITPEFLKAKFIAGEITLAKVLKIYESDIKYFEPLKSILTPTEIEKAHKSNEINDNALMYLPHNSRAAYLQKNNANLSTIMYLFLHCDGISVTELIKLLSANNIIDSLDFYIDEGSSPSRIKELYENFLIDYGCIKNLISTGILKESDFPKYKTAISKEQTYDHIENTTLVNIYGHSNNVPFSTTGSFINENSIKKSILDKSNDLYKVLGATSDINNINTPIIYHKIDKKQAGFLDDYKVIPLKPANLVSLVPREVSKSTYMMPYQEFAYILNNNKLPDSLPDNPCFQEIRFSENMHEELLKKVYQFEESKSYLEKLGFSEDLSFEEAIKIMTEEYIKIKTKGEN